MTVKEQVEAMLQKAGCTVIPLSGDETPDFLVGANGKWHVLECRPPGKALDRTPEQKQFHSSCRGSICTVTSVESALRTVGAMKRYGNWGTIK